MLKNCKVDFLGNSEVAFFYTPCMYSDEQESTFIQQLYFVILKLKEPTETVSAAYPACCLLYIFLLFYILLYLNTNLENRSF